MIKEHIKTRLPGGYFYERIKYLRKYAKSDDRILQNYLKYCEYVYFHGGKNYRGNLCFEATPSGSVNFEDIVLPVLDESAVGTFWSEFPDVLLPYLLEKRGGGKGCWTEIDPLMVEGPYEYDEKVAVQKDDVVIDCGANIGLFSAIAGRKGAHAYAFEPDPNVVGRYLSKTAELNPNIEICPFALSDHSGTAYFNQGDTNIGAGSLGRKTANSLQVKLVTLDEFAAKLERVDYIKADIEGAEREMLKGCTSVLREFAPKLSICTYHLPDDKEVLESIVREANPKYTIRHDYKKMYCYVD